jgi:hypothetical protein
VQHKKPGHGRSVVSTRERTINLGRRPAARTLRDAALRDAALLCELVTHRADSLLDAVHAYETETLDYGFDAVARSLASRS